MSGLAIAAFVCGLLCCLPGVGLVLGLAALARIRRQGERGRGLAIAGAALSVCGIVLCVLAAAPSVMEGFRAGLKDDTGGTSSTGATGGTAVLSLTKGECFDTPGGSLEGYTTDADKVPCAHGHDGEVFATFRMTGGSYPGARVVNGVAGKRCYGLEDGYAMDGWAVPHDVDVYYLTPTQDSWKHGDREVVCVFGNTVKGAQLTGSLRKDASVLDADQVAYLKAAHVLNTAMASAPDTRYVDDDLPGNKAWAGRVVAALTEQAALLRAHHWRPGPKGPVLALTGNLERARAEWAKAAVAADADAFYVHYEAGFGLLDPARTVTARKALGLATTPPARVEHGGGEGGRDSGDRMEV